MGIYVVSTQEKHYIFYKPFTNGSEVMFNPFSVLMNGGLDALQCSEQSANVLHSITSPALYISRYGWNKFRFLPA